LLKNATRLYVVSAGEGMEPSIRVKAIDAVPVKLVDE